MKQLVVLGVSILLPFTIIMLAVRLLFSPLFLSIEYRMPWFPSDVYGFTLEERVKYAQATYAYLLHNNKSVLSLEKINKTPLYTKRELSHLEDVKGIILPLLLFWHLSIILIILIGLFCWKFQLLAVYRKGIYYGGFITLFLIACTGLIGLIAFNHLFNLFHELFFAQDSWLFYDSDTLIRLFPLRFWQDCLSYLLVLIFATSSLAIRSKRR